MLKRLLINGVIIVWAVVAGYMVSQRPWQVYKKESEIANVRVKAMKKAEAERDRLSKIEARHLSSIGREEDVRNAGYIGKGEIASNSTKS